MVIHANEFKTTEKQKHTATYIGKSRQKAGFISPKLHENYCRNEKERESKSCEMSSIDVK